MKKSLILAVAAIATVLVALPSSANAQVAFGGTFRGPHSSFSVGVGGFEPIVGAYVPSPYIHQIYYSPDYGYGFYYDNEWVPCEQYGSGWVIAGAPFFIERPFVRGYAYSRPFVGRTFRRDWDGQRFGRGLSNRSARDFSSRSGRDFSNRSARDFSGRSGRDFGNRSGRNFGGHGSRDNRRW
jgi:hypothetical protein